MKEKIKGIKCDNPDCDFVDDSVTWDDYDKTVSEWLNRPCPKCGTNLLTQESTNEDSTISVEFDGNGVKHAGDGKMNFDLNPQIVEVIYELLKSSEGRQSVVEMIKVNKN